MFACTECGQQLRQHVTHENDTDAGKHLLQMRPKGVALRTICKQAWYTRNQKEDQRDQLKETCETLSTGQAVRQQHFKCKHSTLEAIELSARAWALHTEPWAPL